MNRSGRRRMTVMMWRASAGWVALAVGAVLAVAGCGSAGATSSTVAVNHNQTALRPGYTRTVSVPWKLDLPVRVALSPQSRSVKLLWVGGGCLTPERTKVVQTPQHVEVAVLARLYVPGSGESCTADARLNVVQVHLSEPLGQRTLLHAPVTPGLP